jgi:3-hydroxyacyl-CoA dehydrogenase
MDLNEALKQVSVLGAAGKMGSGISLVLLQEMAIENARNQADFKLILVDKNEEALIPLRHYLKKQLIKYAEKNIIQLRAYYAANPKLISNEEIVQEFMDAALEKISFSCNYEDCKGSRLVFEAILEDVEEKVKAFSKIANLSSKKPYFLTNTSSIPIHILAEKTQLQGRLIGFHFYNPPAVQKLIEIIVPEQCAPELKLLADDLCQRLHKIVVYSKDVAGFIGNGYFAREFLFACKKAQELSLKSSMSEAIVTLNAVTQDLLLRPMGIFQLMDYVGLDVCQKVCQIMNQYHSLEPCKDSLIEQMLQKGLKGGQYADGSQKEGFFQYEGHSLKAVYSFKSNRYQELKPEDVGEQPKEKISWKSLVKDPKREETLKNYFQWFFSSHATETNLAKAFLKNLGEIGDILVSQGVARNLQDVNTVLKEGFYHLYGPSNTWSRP